MSNGTIQRQERLIEVITTGLAAIDAKAGERPAWDRSNHAYPLFTHSIKG